MQWARRREKALDRAYRAAGERRDLTGRDADGERREHAAVAAHATEAGAGGRRETVAGDSGGRQWSETAAHGRQRETVAHGRRAKFLEAERVRLHLERSWEGADADGGGDGGGPAREAVSHGRQGRQRETVAHGRRWRETVSHGRQWMETASHGEAVEEADEAGAARRRFKSQP